MSKQISPKHFFSLLWVKAWFNLKSETNKTYMSYLWWIIEPTLYMTVFYVIFGLVLERGGPGFIWYLLTGLIPFQWFSKTVTESASSILSGKGLMQNIRITPLFFPLAKILKTSLKQIPVFFVLFLVLGFSGDKIEVNAMGALIVIVLQALFMIAFCFLLALLVPFVRDLTRVIPIFLQFLLFSSGVFYSTSRIPENWIEIFNLNPVARILSQYRRVLVDGQLPEPTSVGYILVITLMLFILVFILYKSSQLNYSRLVNE